MKTEPIIREQVEAAEAAYAETTDAFTRAARDVSTPAQLRAYRKARKAYEIAWGAYCKVLYPHWYR